MNLAKSKVLVTGAGGFIGSHLVEHLLHQGAEVRAFVHYNGNNTCGWLDTLPEKIRHSIKIISGDIRDTSQIDEATKGSDIVFHLAALIGIPYSYSAPDSYIDTNIKGTLNILQACRRWDVQKVLITSTSEVYGTAQYVPIDEKHPRQPQSPYAATKISADAIAESFYKSYKTPVNIVRPFNTYGPRQSNRAVIPTIITQLLSGNTEISLGAISPTRDLVFVKDTVIGFSAIASSDQTIGTDINIATQNEISIGDLAKKIIALVNPLAHFMSDETRIRPSSSEVERLLGSSSKLYELTKWKPNTSLDEGLKETIAWFKIPQNLQRYKSEAYVV